MALFGKKTKTEAKPKVEKTAISTMGQVVTHSNPKDVLIRPRISEKASLVSEKQNAYVFDIHNDATKGAVRSAVISTYKVFPIRVSIVKTPAKTVFSRGKYGKGNRGKKAYVYLKAGDKIEFI